MAGTRMRSGVFLGIIPNYATVEGTKGCLIDGTSPDSPAEKGGLKGGDMIVQWNKMPIKNLYDLMKGLNTSKPGDVVTLKVKRNKKDVEPKVKLGSR